MPIKATKSAAELTPAGNHIARLYSVIHIGTLEGEYMGNSKQMDTVRLGFELPNETKVFKEGEEPKPFVVSQDFTLSLGEKANLGKLVRGMRGEAWGPNFDEEQDITELIGTACMLNVIHKTSQAGNEYAKIEGAAPLPKGIEAPPASNPPFILDFQENWDQARFEGLPEFIRTKIQSTPEYRFRADGGAVAAPHDKTPDPDKTYRSTAPASVDYPEEVKPEDIPF